MNVRMRVLFVDDEPNVLEAYRRTLRSHEQVWKMKFLSRARKALTYLADHEVDTIVTDFQMPGMDGFEMIRQIREEHGRLDIPIIVVTGLGEAAGESPFFPPEVVIHLVKLAREMPDGLGRSLSLWDCQELAQQLQASGVVEDISTETVRRILQNHRLKPWRVYMWLGAKTPRDEAFRATVEHICDLYTRKLSPDDMVLGVDEKTSLQPRPRNFPTIPAKPKKPVRYGTRL
jgi:CheY-like chemotaxis protein